MVKMLILFLMVLGLSGCAKNDSGSNGNQTGYTATFTGGFKGAGGTFYFPMRFSYIVLKKPEAAADAVNAITIHADGTFELVTYYDDSFWGVAKSKFYQTGKINEYSNLVSDYWSCGDTEKQKYFITTQIVQEGDNLVVTVFVKTTNEFYTFTATKNFVPEERSITRSIDPNATFGCNTMAYPY